MVLGIDPGTGKHRCGFAIVEKRKLYYHNTTDGEVAVHHALILHNAYHFNKCVIERPRFGVIYKKHLTKRNRITSEAGRAKLAMNIGQNIYLADELKRELENVGVEVTQLEPKKGGVKWSKGYWSAVFKWSHKRLPSEHARDASIIALMIKD